MPQEMAYFQGSFMPLSEAKLSVKTHAKAPAPISVWCLAKPS